MHRSKMSYQESFDDLQEMPRFSSLPQYYQEKIADYFIGEVCVGDHADIRNFLKTGHHYTVCNSLDDLREASANNSPKGIVAYTDAAPSIEWVEEWHTKVGDLVDVMPGTDDILLNYLIVLYDGDPEAPEQWYITAY